MCNTPGYLIATGQIMEYGDLSEYTEKNPRKMSKPGQIINFPGHNPGKSNEPDNAG